MIGIYKILDLTNNQVYIGQSVNIERRFLQHLRKNNIAIDKAIEEKGAQNFSFEVVEQCSKELLNNRQQYWIQYYNSFKNGYNANKGGTASLQNFSFLSKQNIQNIKNELKNTQKSILQIANQYNINKSTVYRINIGEIHFKSQEKYPLREKIQTSNRKIYNQKIYKCEKCGAIINNSKTHLCRKCYNKKLEEQSKINLITREQLKERIRKESFTSIAKDFNITDNAIRKWCDKFNLPRTKKEIKSYSDQEWKSI